MPSAPLVPANDPTLLFTNSGMVQFKNIFLGLDSPPCKTAVTAQRCLRAGGKHNDLGNVGYTARHHTFFEMLGNFSFGDYFKERAIPLAWEFLTSPAELAISRDHLWITVFGGGKIFGDNSAPVPSDEAAFDIWLRTLQNAGFSEDEARRRITRVPTTDNFWMMGDTGPCGPCSEIFYDTDGGARAFRGEDAACADECVEIWNLVFMEFSRDDSGAMRKLPAPCVDTGMGLERIAAVMQKARGNYDTDLFQQLLAAANAEIVRAGGDDCGGEYAPSHRVVADHIRAAAYLIADGVLPGNEGRGYVLRKIIRRALIHGGKAGKKPQLGQDSEWFAELSQRLPVIMAEAGDILLQKSAEIRDTLAREERGFFNSFVHGRAHLQKKMNETREKNQKKNQRVIKTPAQFPGKPDCIKSGEDLPLFPGEIAFELYDTYGFPIEATDDEVRDNDFAGVDMAKFEECMNAQRARSRAATKFGGGARAVLYDGAASEFIGYDNIRGEATILAIFADGAPVREAAAGDDVLLVFNRTPFYAEAGGQTGDAGIVKNENGEARIRDTQKIRADTAAHAATITGGVLSAGMKIVCEVDAARRRRIARNHSATHLMHAALRQVLGAHVRQKGSLVAPDHLRFDFSHDAAPTDSQICEVEQIVNEKIRANIPVAIESLPFADAVKKGATALFGEKYGDIVRVVAMDSAFSMELCGGTHVVRTGDIGFFQCIGESAIAAGIRRAEAVSGDAAIARARRDAATIKQIAAAVKSPPDKAAEKIAQLRDSLKTAQKEVAALRRDRTESQSIALAAAAENAGGIDFVIAEVPGADLAALRDIAGRIRRQLPSGAVFLACKDGGKAAFVAAADGKKMDAGKWLSAAAEVANAKGGGKPGYAQAGGGDPAKINAALRAARESQKNA